jgi:hypothetical protein
MPATTLRLSEPRRAANCSAVRSVDSVDGNLRQRNSQFANIDQLRPT